MYLRTLEIQGFKSFPEKTRLTFDKPITAIVGPNGSGKSNISDAILWVMGEQSTRTLRGGKMEDVIFGGTQRRSQVGFAEVTLVLDNCDRVFDLDDSEVAITRRYYRSGESEYYINKQIVRLRDVNELLMDTGLGREGYSIIGQGKIDAILSAKSTDRREIFEEAAGISRFRHRKEDSERKLQHTEENLLRLGDKISELSLQVEPLREQAETARKYLIYRDELRGIEISVWMDSLDHLQVAVKKTAEDQIAAAEQKTSVETELQQFYEGSQTFSDKMRDKDIEADGVRGKISEAEGQSSELDSAVAVLRSKLENNIGESDRIKRELAEQEGRDGGIKAQIDERSARITEITNEKSELSEASSGLLRELDALTDSAGEAAKKLGELIKSENDMLGSISDHKARLSALASTAQEMYDRESTVALETAAASDKLSQLDAEASACNDELKKAKSEADSLKNMISGHAIRVESRRKKAEAAGDKKTKVTIEQNALKSRMSLLTEMERDYQGYSKAVKIVMQEAQRGILKNIHGTVAGLIKTDDKFTIAVETALGGAMQNIIVGTEEDGKEAINMLKRRDGGRATFLPISTIRGNVINEKGLFTEAGFAGIALDLVRFDPKYEGVYMSLLGRVAIVEDMDDAIRISRKYRNSFRIVTLDGQVINAGGSMTGGSSASNAGILSRANELVQLAEQEKIVAQSLLRAEHELSEAVRELSAAEYELDVANAEMRTAEDKILKLETNSNHYKLLLEAASFSLEALKTEASTLAERIVGNGRETDEVRTAILSCESQATEIRSSITAATVGQEQLSADRDRITNSLSELRAREASCDAEREALMKAVSELSALREDLTGGRMQQISFLEALKLKNEEILNDIAANEIELGKLAEKIEGFKNRVTKITEEKLEMEAERTRRDKMMQEKNRELLELERECARLEQKKLAAEMEEKQIVDKLWDTYEVSRTTAIGLRQELTSLPEAKRRIAELKKEIGKLGNPNIGAIDEFDRVNARYTYLTEQRDDVEKAKNDLTSIIRDITSEMRSIFTREFDVINTSFKQTFLELFGGGQASLELEEPDDILNCGIEIKVQPPGKSLKTLTLLSGGEKAFVAIALYFAILKVRPTPFVVMDEIEAALDETNVLRFAEYMRRMSDRTQMVVITHHRGTMEEADVLYGVTMQEQGVSRVLSIDLEEAERLKK